MSKGAIDVGHRGQPPGEGGGWKREREDLGGKQKIFCTTSCLDMLVSSLVLSFVHQ